MVVSGRSATLFVLTLITLAGCAEDLLRTDYLESRTLPKLQVPAGLDRPVTATGVTPPTPERLQAIDTQGLVQPPRIVDVMQAAQREEARKSRVASELKTDASGVTFLQVELDFDPAWRQVRLALLSVGFTLTDENRSEGLLYIRYRDPEGKKGQREEFALHLLQVGGASRLLVRSVEGEILADATAGRILTLVHDNL